MIKEYLYKGYYISFNFYGRLEFTVFYNGDDVFFKTKADAENFIDSLQGDKK